MADDPKPLKKGAYIDVDSDDSFLDLAVPRYEGRTSHQDRAVLDDFLDAQKRGEAPKTMPLPPHVDH